MEYKKNGVTFLASLKSVETAYTDKAQYKFIHPNFEAYSSYITRHQRQEGDLVFVHFSFDRACAKSNFTYKYFDLKGLEVNSYNAAQGIPVSFKDEIKLQELQLLIQQKGDLINQLLERIGRDRNLMTGVEFNDIQKAALPKLPGLPGGGVLALPTPGKTSR